MLKTDVVVIGAGAANLKRFTWEKLPEGMYPFTEEIQPLPAKIWK